ncbi:ATP-binding protein [Desulfobulbus sp.]|uniref:tRNA lysidine(34) synthetase n=1 Tax=Desulfobulbus sp. TaxID=895 RepID=UPI00286F14B5|nr:ATP-binding protein [Desulfobulbus sp.]
MHDYAMLADGDRVLVAVSGGIDSLVLAWLLADWRKKAPIRYELAAVHVDMEPGEGEGGPGEAAIQVGEIVERIGLPLHILPARWRPDPETTAGPGGHDLCFQCARSRRTQLFSHARDHGCTTVAFGHHRDDIIETFLLNLTCAGNISTMVPRQALFAGRLGLIRPLAYLDKSEIETIGRQLGFSPVRSRCPLREATKRRDIHLLAEHIYRQVPGAKEHIFAALGNVRSPYLLRQTGGRRP